MEIHKLDMTEEELRDFVEHLHNNGEEEMAMALLHGAVLARIENDPKLQAKYDELTSAVDKAVEEVRKFTVGVAAMISEAGKKPQ